jgi:hypothetical protein
MWPFEKPCGHLALFRDPCRSLGGHVAIWPFGAPCGHLASLGYCAHLALRKDMSLPGPFKGHVSIWSSDRPCGQFALRRPGGPLRSPVATWPFSGAIWPSGSLGSHVAIWPFGGTCGHLVSQGSCAHLALRKDMWLPGPLKGHVSIWPFEGPCGHLAP